MRNRYGLIKLFLFFVFHFGIVYVLNASEYHIGSYNILVGKENSSWSKRVDNLCNFILFNNFDILGTQEVSPYQLEFLKKNLKEEYAFFGVGREDGKNKGEYCAIFFKSNKFKILDGNTFWLSETPTKVSKGWDAMYHRICTWVRLKDKDNNNEIWFFNTHFDHKGKKAREESCKLIIKKIEELCPRNANIVLTGDFNIYHNNPIFKILLNSNLLKDTYSSAKYKWVPTGTFNGNHIDKINMVNFDHIFVSKTSNVSRYGVLNNNSFIVDDKAVTDIRKVNENEIKKKTVNILPLSDHYPVSVFIDFKTINNQIDINSNNTSNSHQNDSIENYLLNKIFKKKK